MSTTILQGDWIHHLRSLPENSVHCCVTSPPYFGLRNYQAEGQIGVEKTPQEYIDNLVAGFREVRRVLRQDGSLWLNLGDSYAANRSYQTASTRGGPKHGNAQTGSTGNSVPEGWKPKDLIGIPHRVAFALQADGWWLRAICPWIKRNGMPESCRDRPTQTIEYVFLLTKSPTYFYDAEAVKMKGVCPAGTKGAKGSTARQEVEGANARPPEYKIYDGTRLRRTSDWFFESFSGLATDEVGDPLAFVVNTKPFKGAHFATFPAKLVEPCILAGTSTHGCCAACGAPYERTIQTPDFTEQPKRGEDSKGDGTPDPRGFKTSAGQAWQKWCNEHPDITTGWRATCVCNADVVSCSVLDPFGGSGTVAEVAGYLARRSIIIELNPDYIPLIQARIST